ncbi:hypothetical protein MB84_01770 [Pandoraea oxalativorans]|uniref:Uncharacterized protein n=1 Tax=Pandoraea oxalativorans TaxID=573737 RepID=A0A0E3YA48_9BURK|nr:hypothetical protein MB84_01770 [Pandoraea oxalativorans]
MQLALAPDFSDFVPTLDGLRPPICAAERKVRARGIDGIMPNHCSRRAASRTPRPVESAAAPSQTDGAPIALFVSGGYPGIEPE